MSQSIWHATCWVDGSYYKHGGAAAILLAPDGRQTLVTRGEMAPTSNQRMELLAAIIALDRLWWRPKMRAREYARKKKRVRIYSDSAYLCNCFRDGWIDNWRVNGWKTAGGKEVANRELWETLEALVAQYGLVRFEHVKGHTGIVYNELADEQARLCRISMEARAANLKSAGIVESPDGRRLPQSRTTGRQGRIRGRRG